MLLIGVTFRRAYYRSAEAAIEEEMADVGAEMAFAGVALSALITLPYSFVE